MTGPDPLKAIRAALNELLPDPKPYEGTEKMRVCTDSAMWQIWVWDGETRCSKGHANMLEVDGEGTWCAQVVAESYGPLSWYRLEELDVPTAKGEGLPI